MSAAPSGEREKHVHFGWEKREALVFTNRINGDCLLAVRNGIGYAVVTAGRIRLLAISRDWPSPCLFTAAAKAINDYERSEYPLPDGPNGSPYLREPTLILSLMLSSARIAHKLMLSPNELLLSRQRVRPSVRTSDFREALIRKLRDSDNVCDSQQ